MNMRSKEENSGAQYIESMQYKALGDMARDGVPSGEQYQDSRES